LESNTTSCSGERRDADNSWSEGESSKESSDDSSLITSKSKVWSVKESRSAVVECKVKSGSFWAVVFSLAEITDNLPEGALESNTVAEVGDWGISVTLASNFVWISDHVIVELIVWLSLDWDVLESRSNDFSNVSNDHVLIDVFESWKEESSNNWMDKAESMISSWIKVSNESSWFTVVV
jgi:hypothetical protein